MTVRLCTSADTEALLALFDEARKTIATLGIDQWQKGYPSREAVEEDLKAERSYLLERDGDLCGTFVFLTDGEPTYDKIYDGAWHGDENYVALHRVAVAVKHRGTGVAETIISFAREKAKAMGFSSLRIDTHKGNKVMRRMLEKNGFIPCGTIYLINGDERIAYDKIL